MLTKAVAWVKTHKLVLSLLAIVGYLLINSGRYSLNSRSTSMSYGSAGVASTSLALPSMMDSSFMKNSSIVYAPPSVPRTESVDINATDRKVVRNSDLSLLVKDVRSSIDQIVQLANTTGGFMVNSSLSTPEQGGTGSVTIRVPADKLDDTLQTLRGLAIRVVSENITGSDVTDQFTDTQARLATLTKTKSTFEAMLDKATTVDEILRVQQSILQMQDQIDALKGRLQYLDKTSQSSVITVILSTDELALPYSPSEPWRPEVVFKTAVRSLVANLRQIGSAGIWLFVYSPVILVLGFIILIVKRKMK